MRRENKNRVPHFWRCIWRKEPRSGGRRNSNGKFCLPTQVKTVKKAMILIVLVVWMSNARAIFAQIDFTQYHTPASLASDLASLAANHPATSQLFTVGTSVEGRQVQGIKISTNPAVDDPSKGDVIFVWLHHAREWLAAEMPLRLAEYLLTNTDPNLQACMSNLQIWIIPVLNPDGYAYTADPNGYRY